MGWHGLTVQAVMRWNEIYEQYFPYAKCKQGMFVYNYDLFVYGESKGKKREHMHKRR